MEINLTDLRDELLNIILEEPKLIKYFNNNKPIPVDKFINYIINDEEPFTMRKDKKHFKKDTLSKISYQESVTPSGFYSTIRSIMLGKTKNKENNKYNYINPILLLIFYNRLENDGFEFVTTVNGFMEIRHTSKEITISSKIMESFKIFISIFTDKNLETLLPKIKNRIVKNFIVGKSLTNLPYYKCDIYCRISVGQVLMINLENINSNSTEIFNKDAIVLSRYDTIMLHFDVSSSTEQFMKKLTESIAKKSYFEFNAGAVSYYLSLKGIDPTYCLFFANVYETQTMRGILLNDIVDFLKQNDFKNPLKCFKKGIKEGDLVEDDFNHSIDSVIEAIGKKTKKLPKIYITYTGFHSLMNYPRNCDWPYASKVKKYFAIFTEGYFTFIKDFLGNVNNERKYWKKSNKQLKEFNTIHKLIKYSILKYLEDIIKNKSTTLNLHPLIPILIKSESDKIPMLGLLENIYGLNLKLGQQIEDHPNFNSIISNDIKYRLSQLETKEYIEGYRIINESELKSLI
tara:strand:- start:3636 stop:5180 length:1545 start_codon:yes stop_codon:yes gene_type:complete